MLRVFIIHTLQHVIQADDQTPVYGMGLHLIKSERSLGARRALQGHRPRRRNTSEESGVQRPKLLKEKGWRSSQRGWSDQPVQTSVWAWALGHSLKVDNKRFWFAVFTPVPAYDGLRSWVWRTGRDDVSIPWFYSEWKLLFFSFSFLFFLGWF